MALFFKTFRFILPNLVSPFVSCKLHQTLFDSCLLTLETIFNLPFAEIKMNTRNNSYKILPKDEAEGPCGRQSQAFHVDFMTRIDLPRLPNPVSCSSPCFLTDDIFSMLHQLHKIHEFAEGHVCCISSA